MPLAREGLREISIATLLMGGLAFGAAQWTWALAVPFVLLWLWVLWFFRDPRRVRSYSPGDLCSPADGTVTEITEYENDEWMGGPAVRIGIFLSLFNVHVNRSPCAGRIRSLAYHRGEFLDARHPEAGRRNESNTLVIDPDPPIPGPVVVRQIAGLVARRIRCHAVANEHMACGYRFGMIKFGSRTELIIPRLAQTDILIKVGDSVKGGLTILATQPAVAGAEDHTESSVVAAR